MPLIEAANAHFGYRRRAVVGAVNGTVDRGRCLGVYGPNGVGKTTLLRGLTRLIPPISGEVRIAAATRFGYLPQQRATESHWPMTAMDAASLAASARQRFGFAARAASAVRQQLEALDVAELSQQPFFELSGGQQQRVLLAGALAAEPDVLLLDEPAGGLDLRSRDLLLDRLAAARDGGLAIVLVTHDLPDLLALADDALLLEPADDPADPSKALAMTPAELAERLTARAARRSPATNAGAGR